jgi:hypothetical protein
MRFNSLFEIVNVDELNVKLILEMLYVLELVFGEREKGCFLEFAFVAGKFFPKLTKCIPPGTALLCELCDFNLNHGFKI